MKRQKILPSEGNSSKQTDYGKALMNKNGGWTLGELKPSLAESVLTRNGFERVLQKVSSRVSEPASGTKQTSG
jgi:hypothetical protein